MEEKGAKKKSKSDKNKEHKHLKMDGEKNLGSSFELEADGEKRKKHKEKRKNKHGLDKEFGSSEVQEENCTDKAAEGQTCPIEGDIAFVRDDKEEGSKTKRKKRKVGSDDDELVNNSVADENKMQPSYDNQERKKKKRKVLDNLCAETHEDHASKQGKKSKSKEDREFKSKNDARVDTRDTKANSPVSEVDGQGMKMEIEKKEKKIHAELDSYASGREVGNTVADADDQSKKIEMKKKKKKIHTELDNYASGREVGNTVADADDQSKKIETKKKKKKKKKKDTELDKNASGKEVGNAVASADKSADVALEGKSKRVTFADQVDVLNDGLVRGKRFTPEEDEKIKEAVFNYIESHGLGDDGLDMVLHCKSHRGMRNCWKEIGASLPHRPYESVYYRAHILFERDEQRKWTTEEYEFVRNFQEKHGSDWKTMAEALGKHRFHVKDAWRRIKLANTNKGHWTQEEYQNLFDLVNVDLRVRAQEECRKSKYGMLRDNICWEAIGDKLATRTSARCCMKWYEQLTSPMVAEGMWTDTDDYRLLDALVTLDACCMEEVEWDYLLEHRAGDLCRKRWNQMVMQIGEHGNKSFAEQVEILSKRYRPDLVEAREAFDSKPVVT